MANGQYCSHNLIIAPLACRRLELESGWNTKEKERDMRHNHTSSSIYALILYDWSLKGSLWNRLKPIFPDFGYIFSAVLSFGAKNFNLQLEHKRNIIMDTDQPHAASTSTRQAADGLLSYCIPLSMFSCCCWVFHWHMSAWKDDFVSADQSEAIYWWGIS